MIILFYSCKTGIISGKRAPHELYEAKLKDAGLEQSALGVQWLAAAREARLYPVAIDLPFKEKGYFAAERPAAIGYRFAVKRGMEIFIWNRAKADSGAAVFLDVWRVRGKNVKRLAGTAAMDDTIQVVMDADQDILIRIQPELLTSAQYELTVNFGPSLAFPVDASGKPVIISYWGASRDAGARKHEGIDIRAARYTPALAAADGYARAADNQLGGKVVFINNQRLHLSMYYAHLDSQLVRTGEFVRRGDTVGLIGNTGNARGTVPHLHFGIYTETGAVDPKDFITPNTLKPEPITTSRTGVFMASVSTNINVRMSGSEKRLAKGTPLRVTGANGSSYRARLPDANYVLVPEKYIQTGPIAHMRLKEETVLLDAPDSSGVGKLKIQAGHTIPVFGNYSGFTLTEVDGVWGWSRLPG